MIEQQEMVGTESEFLLEHLYIHGGASTVPNFSAVHAR